MTSFPSACEVLRSKTWRPTPGQEINYPAIIYPQAHVPEGSRGREIPGEKAHTFESSKCRSHCQPVRAHRARNFSPFGKKKKKIFFSFSLDKDFPWRKRSKRIFRSPTFEFQGHGA